MSTAEGTTPGTAPAAGGAQAAVAQMRAGLLGGRGPGVSRSEFLGHTRAGLAVGGVPVPVLRESVAADAARARRDADVLALAVGEQRDRLAADLGRLLDRAPPRAARPRGLDGRARRRFETAVLLTAPVLAAALLVRGRCRRRRSRRPGR